MSKYRCYMLVAGMILSAQLNSAALWEFGHTVRKSLHVSSIYSLSSFHTLHKRPYSARISKQVYTIPTYDAAFKWVLSDDQIRPSFFHAFVPNLVIKSSERLDEHMNPTEKLQLLRTFLHDKKTLDIAAKLSSLGSFVVAQKDHQGALVPDDQSTSFLEALMGRFEEICYAFPKQKFDGVMDFACRLDNGEYALIEMQVIPQNYWDRRALAYLAAFYGNQLSRGEQWKHIRKVIGINILGGGKDEKVHFNGKKGRFIDGIELIQYSVMKAPTVDDQEKQDWLTFFKKAAYMTEEEVQATIKTEAVKQAFERAKIDRLPTDVLNAYEAEDKEYDQYSQHTADLVSKGKTEEKLQIAKSMKAGGMSIGDIVKYTGLNPTEIEKL